MAKDLYNINVKEVNAYMFNEKIGTLYDHNGIIYFQYSKAFQRLGLKISPYKLPLDIDGLYTNKSDVEFKGLPGIFYDSLPDSHGMAIMDRYFEEKEIDKNSLSLIHRLMFVGDRGIGAIEYKPREHDTTKQTEETISIIDVYNKSKEILSNTKTHSIEELMSYIDSASPIGGAKPKMMINYNPSNKLMKYNSKFLDEGYERYIIKFDRFRNDESFDETKIEFMYMSIAKELGITVPKFDLQVEDSMSHFIIKRFDRKDNDEKIHVATAAALMDINIKIPRAMSYEDLFEFAYSLTDSIEVITELFRRVVFNIIFVNNDTHAKNFTFMMDTNGVWTIAPAYDLIYSKGPGVMYPFATIKGKQKDYEKEDFLYLGRIYNLNEKDMNEIIDSTINKTLEVKDRGIDLGISPKNLDPIIMDIKDIVLKLK